MDLLEDEQQRALRASIERLFEAHDTMAGRAAAVHAGTARGSRALWQRYAQLGLLGLVVAPEHGGSGCGPAEVAVVAQALGRALVLEPWLPTAVIGTRAIERAGTARQQAALLPRIAAGELSIAWAHDEDGAEARLSTHARASATGWSITGAKRMALHADSVDRILVTARIDGGHGVALFLVDPAARGLARTDFALQDGRSASHLSFDHVSVAAEDRLGEGEGDGAALVEELLDHAVAAQCAEAVGVMQEMLDRTVEHLKTRRQFGVAIGSFQVLQHRAVDMLVALDAARSMALYAAGMVLDPDPLERRRAVAASKVQVGRSARFIGQQAVQLHGGMGQSMESKVAQCFLRASAIEQLFGSADAHLRTLARLGGLVRAE